jgi:hypothetical protein
VRDRQNYTNGSIEVERKSVVNDAHSRWTSTIKHIEVNDLIYQPIRDNLRINTDKNASEMDMTHRNKEYYNCLRSKIKQYILSET